PKKARINKRLMRRRRQKKRQVNPKANRTRKFPRLRQSKFSFIFNFWRGGHRAFFIVFYLGNFFKRAFMETAL
ncbi:MAG: hypothetical protein J6R08_01665, partial [Opitutales bacterium]|nr:hypothetical protein [Opitutales bacterium]